MQQWSEYQESEIIREVAAGNEAAFRKLFFYYRPRLISFVLGLSRSTDAAEDIVHDIFLDIWKNRERLSVVENFNSYLFQAVRYKAHRQFQRRAKEVLIMAELSRDETSAHHEEPAETLTLRSVHEFIRQRIHHLTPSQRKVFLLSREKGLSHAQIAGQLGIRPQTVSNHLSDALRILRQEIDTFYGPPALAIFVLHGIN